MVFMDFVCRRRIERDPVESASLGNTRRNDSDLILPAVVYAPSNSIEPIHAIPDLKQSCDLRWMHHLNPQNPTLSCTLAPETTLRRSRPVLHKLHWTVLQDG